MRLIRSITRPSRIYHMEEAFPARYVLSLGLWIRPRPFIFKINTVSLAITHRPVCTLGLLLVYHFVTVTVGYILSVPPYVRRYVFWFDDVQFSLFIKMCRTNFGSQSWRWERMTYEFPQTIITASCLKEKKERTSLRLWQRTSDVVSMTNSGFEEPLT